MKKISSIIEKFETKVEDFKTRNPLFVPLFEKALSYNPEYLITLRHKGMAYAQKKLGTLMYKISRNARNEYCELYDNFVKELWSNKYHIKLNELLNHNIAITKNKHDSMLPIKTKLEKGGYFNNGGRFAFQNAVNFFASDTVNCGQIILYNMDYIKNAPVIYIPSTSVLSIEIPTQKERARYIYNSLTK